MLILGIETSCDETAAALVADGVRVLSHVVATQHELHEEFLGVVPEIASRAHLERILPTLEAARRDAGVDWADLDAIAVGNRPGLIGSLIVGVSAAKALAWSLDKPLLGVDHVQAHLHAARLVEVGSGQPPEVPPEISCLGLVVSGGHTSLYTFTDPTALTLIGRTIDDAVGEAFDKAAVILGLGYPGGPRIDQLARQGDERAYDLPRSMLAPGSLDFSFSGLKTALLYAVRGQPQGRGKDVTFERDISDFTPEQVADLAASFQAAAVDAVIAKLQRAIVQLTEQGRRPGELILGGGVSANSRLRAKVAQLGERHALAVRMPAMQYCVDNAAMIAGLAHLRLTRGDVDALDLPAVASSKV